LHADTRSRRTGLTATALANSRPTGSCLGLLPVKGLPFYGLSDFQKKALTAQPSSLRRGEQEPTAVNRPH